MNRDATLAGTVPVVRLILASADQRMAELASDRLLSVTPETRDNDIFELFDKYNLRSLTVVNERKTPIGSIAVDDIVSRLRAKL
jgi:magnesium transporter